MEKNETPLDLDDIRDIPILSLDQVGLMLEDYKASIITGLEKQMKIVAERTPMSKRMRRQKQGECERMLTTLELMMDYQIAQFRGGEVHSSLVEKLDKMAKMQKALNDAGSVH